MSRRFFWLLVAGMVLGVAVGWALHAGLPSDAARKAASDGLSLITDVFLRLIKMIIAPLVFTTLVAGIAHMEDAAAIGRVGAKTLGWFLAASIVSLLIGLGMVHLLHPGSGLHLTPPPAGAATGVAAAKLSLKDFVEHVVPASIVDAMAKNEILQIVVFAVFTGVAVAAVEDRAPAIRALVEQVAAVMLKVTGYVMRLAPLAVFAALSATVATQGLAVLGKLALFVGGFYLSLAILWLVLFLAGLLFAGARMLKLPGLIREPALIAFSAASSEAAYPKTMEALERFGVPRPIVSFVLPLGYSFNLDGSMMYCTFATLFIAQAYGIEMSLGQQVVMLLVFMITSKGIAGVPRASLVVIAAGLSYFHLPEAGLLLILTVDHLLDMGRSATNVVGNSVAAAVIGRWERGRTPPPAMASPQA